MEKLTQISNDTGSILTKSAQILQFQLDESAKQSYSRSVVEKVVENTIVLLRTQATKKDLEDGLDSTCNFVSNEFREAETKRAENQTEHDVHAKQSLEQFGHMRGAMQQMDLKLTALVQVNPNLSIVQTPGPKD